MAKNIILLSDGTGNSAAKFFKSNVWRLYQALDLSGPDQIAFYDDGVGTSSFRPLALLGGAFGWGLKRNVLDLYTFLCRNYQDGDRIYCFGFSRGAFTVRMLVGLVITQGLVQADSESERKKLAKAAFRHFRREFSSQLRLEFFGRAVRDTFVGVKHYNKIPKKHPNIAFLGVWDTVAAYGLPIAELTRAWNWVFPLVIPDREPNLERVNRICHAIALDDERNTFHPVLFNEGRLSREHSEEHRKAKRIDDERLTQVWFAGMHSNVGGGYPDDALAHVSLRWMMERASGLKCKPRARWDVAVHGDPTGKMYDSRSGFGGFYRYLPRRMDLLTKDTDDPKDQVVIEKPKIHHSVVERIKNGVDRYAPIVLPDKYAVVIAAGDIQDPSSHIEDDKRAEARYKFQEHVWDWVWWRRVVYFSSVAVFAILAAFPLIRPATRDCERRLCAAAVVVDWAGALLPSYVEPWLEAFGSHPTTFLVILAALGGLLYAGSAIQDQIYGLMNQWWEHTRNTSAPAPNFPDPSGFPFRLRNSAIYKELCRLLKQFILPLLFGLAAVVAIFGIASRLGFLVASSAGLVCSAHHLPAEPFQTRSVCWASGLRAEQGRTYRIAIDVDAKDAWFDFYEPAEVQGVINPTLFMSLFAPFRRHLDQPWFKPMARIGETGRDDYALDGEVSGRTLTADFTARRSGQLYFFVNDAVLPFPNVWQVFYNNNRGSAKISIAERPRP